MHVQITDKVMWMEQFGVFALDRFDLSPRTENQISFCIYSLRTQEYSKKVFFFFFLSLFHF